MIFRSQFTVCNYRKGKAWHCSDTLAILSISPGVIFRCVGGSSPELLLLVLVDYSVVLAFHEPMPYSDFTVRKVKQTFGINTIENQKFLPDIPIINPTPTLASFLEESLPLAIATGSEKARSELIISPVLLEVRKILHRTISLFSGADFSVDPSLGLTGVCDFILSLSPEQLEVEAPVVVIVEAKKADLNSGIGQCIAEMIAAQKFNEINQPAISTIYGSVTNGTAWRFLQLKEQTVTIDLTDYPLPPVDVILGILVWMVTCAK